MGGLAVIVFSDLVSSTALLARLGDDEMDRVRRAHVADVRAVVRAHGGVVVKTLGDGVMARFESALGALRAASSVQDAVARLDAAEGAIGLAARVGVAAGEPIQDGKDLHGMAVVIASRLCAVAPTGAVLVHELVGALVASREGVVFDERATFELRGVPDPVGASLLRSVDGALPLAAPAAGTLEPVPASTTGSLLERDDVLAGMQSLVDAAIAGDGSALLLEAPAGIGKTSVLDEARARARGVRVLSARGVEQEREFPLGVVRQLLTPMLRAASPEELERWLAGGAAVAAPVLRGEASGPVEEAVAFHALYWLVDAIAADAPLALVVDDLHWSDPESLRWLGFLVRRMEGLPLAVLLATRPGEGGVNEPVLAALRDELAVRTVELDPLSAASTELLIRDRAEAPEDAFVQACHDACGGNPFLLRELLAAVEHAGFAPTAANAARVASLASAGLQRAVTLRLNALGLDAQAAARACALLGADVPLARVAAMADMALQDTAAAARALDGAEILRPGAHLDFCHPLLRAAVLGEMGDAMVAAGHVRAARVLRDLDGSAEDVAGHLLACESIGEEWAADVLERAAADAQAHAAQALAARLLERALAEPLTPQRRAQLEAAMGEALVTIGDERGLDALLRAHAGMRDPTRRAAILIPIAAISMQMATAGRRSELVDLLEAARRELPADDQVPAFRLAAARAMTAAQINLEPVAPALAAALELVPDSDEPHTRAGIASLAVVALATNCPALEIAALARRALGDEAAHELSISIGHPMTYALWALDVAEHDAGVVEGYARCEAGVRRRGAIGIGLVSTLGWRAVFHARRGALLDAEADAHAALEAAPREHFLQLRTFPATALAMIQRERGDPARALRTADDQLHLSNPLFGGQALLVVERARALHALGQPAEAVAVALASGAELRALDIDSPAIQPWRQVAAEALLTCGDDARAAQLAAEELKLAEHFGAPGPIGCALRVLGLAERDLDRLRAAERTLAGSVLRLEHARALVDLGAAMRRDGQRAAAREPLAAGMEIAHRCGATALVERAHEELRASGSRPRSVLRSGVEALTTSELRAARLAADGLTNREVAQHLFVTQKTVESQLRAAYRKLDISGRGDLAGALAD